MDALTTRPSELLFILEKFWLLSVFRYTSGFTKNPTYREVCGGMTNHNEVVQIVYPPFAVSYQDLLKVTF